MHAWQHGQRAHRRSIGIRVGTGSRICGCDAVALRLVGLAALAVLVGAVAVDAAACTHKNVFSMQTKYKFVRMTSMKSDSNTEASSATIHRT